MDVKTLTSLTRILILCVKLLMMVYCSIEIKIIEETRKKEIRFNNYKQMRNNIILLLLPIFFFLGSSLYGDYEYF